MFKRDSQWPSLLFGNTHQATPCDTADLLFVELTDVYQCGACGEKVSQSSLFLNIGNVNTLAIMTLQCCNIVMFQFVFTEISCFILKFCFSVPPFV